MASRTDWDVKPATLRRLGYYIVQVIQEIETDGFESDWCSVTVPYDGELFVIAVGRKQVDKWLMHKAGELWMRSHGECPLHGLVEGNHTCRDYDGEVFSPNGYFGQGYERARKYLDQYPER